MNLMFYIVHFKRAAQKLVRLEEYADRDKAVQSLRASERENTDDDLELVLLSGDSEEVLRRTHSRYFGPTDISAVKAAL
jgi:hypothetical protein